jgi:hypothetical protein
MSVTSLCGRLRGCRRKPAFVHCILPGCNSVPHACRLHSQPTVLSLLQARSCADQPGHPFNAQHDCGDGGTDQDGQVPAPAPHDVAARYWTNKGFTVCESRNLPVNMWHLKLHPRLNAAAPHLYSVAFRVNPFCGTDRMLWTPAALTGVSGSGYERYQRITIRRASADVRDSPA